MVFILLVRYMVARPAIAKFFGQAEVDDIHQVSGIVKTHHKISGLDVAVDIVAGMNKFYS